MVSPHKGELDVESLLKEQVAPEDPAGVKCMLLQLVPSNASSMVHWGIILCNSPSDDINSLTTFHDTEAGILGIGCNTGAK